MCPFSVYFWRSVFVAQITPKHSIIFIFVGVINIPLLNKNPWKTGMEKSFGVASFIF